MAKWKKKQKQKQQQQQQQKTAGRTVHYELNNHQHEPSSNAFVNYSPPQKKAKTKEEKKNSNNTTKNSYVRWIMIKVKKSEHHYFQIYTISQCKIQHLSIVVSIFRMRKAN